MTATIEWWDEFVYQRCVDHLSQGGFTVDQASSTVLDVYVAEVSGMLGLSSVWYYEVTCSKEVIFATGAGWGTTRAAVWRKRDLRAFTAIGGGAHMRSLPHPLLAEFLLDYHQANRNAT